VSWLPANGNRAHDSPQKPGKLRKFTVDSLQKRLPNARAGQSAVALSGWLEKPLKPVHLHSELTRLLILSPTFARNICRLGHYHSSTL
jgi:hypothetical protein